MEKIANKIVFEEYVKSLDQVSQVQIISFIEEIKKNGILSIPVESGQHFIKSLKLLFAFDQPKFLFNKKISGQKIILGKTPNFYFIICENKVEYKINIFFSKVLAEEALLEILSKNNDRQKQIK